jgi:transketolase
MTPAAVAIRENILRASHATGHGHIPSSFSIVELALGAYAALRHDPSKPGWPDRDIFVLSKGHAALGYYCVLAQLGYFSPESVRTFGQFGSRFGCHPDRTKVPGVEASCGSLGHGIGIAAGMALAQRVLRTDRRVAVLIGDGEANEGSVWEAVMVASDRQLANLTILYDHNRSQQRCLQIPNPAARLAAFGCDVAEVDGHDEDAVRAAVEKSSTTVKAIVGHTEKGHGSATLSAEFLEWHRKAPGTDVLEILLAEIHA